MSVSLLSISFSPEAVVVAEEEGDSSGACDNTGRPGRNFKDSGLGVSAVWMKSVLVWMMVEG